MADEKTVEEITGAKVGFAGPIDLKGKVHAIIIDHAVAAMAVGVTGANKTDYHLKNIVPGRDFPLKVEIPGEKYSSRIFAMPSKATPTTAKNSSSSTASKSARSSNSALNTRRNWAVTS